MFTITCLHCTEILPPIKRRSPAHIEILEISSVDSVSPFLLALAFHSDHEGHKLKIERDGVQIHPVIGD